MEAQELNNPSYVLALLPWRADLARFHSEVEEASERGFGDPLTLAEMECSLDLIDADILALRSVKAPEERTRTSLAEASKLREELLGLIVRLTHITA
jgi:hypothetical protein